MSAYGKMGANLHEPDAEEYSWDDDPDYEERDDETYDCMDCGMCDSCIARTKAYFDEMSAASPEPAPSGENAK